MPIHYYYLITIWTVCYLIEVAILIASYKAIKQQLKTAIPPEAKMFLTMAETTPQFAPAKQAFDKLKAKLQSMSKNPFYWVVFHVLIFQFAPLLLLGAIFAAVKAKTALQKVKETLPPNPADQVAHTQPTHSDPTTAKKVNKPID